MSAKEHDHDHDHSDHHDHHDEPMQPVPATPSHGYWKSLRELAGKADWQTSPTRKEFRPGSDKPPELDPMSRRNFFHLMGASMGLAGLGAAAAGCRYDKEEIVPLARRPEDQTPGQTLQYATVYDLAGVAHPLVATSFEGRPIHLDGNPEHPFSGGGVNPATKKKAGAHTFAQASILHVYDPDRSQNPLAGGKGASLDGFKVSLTELRKNLGNGGTRVLAEANSSPTLAALKAQLAAQGVRWHEYEPISWDNERAGMQLAFGEIVRPLARLDKCETIVSIDGDLFVEHPAAMRYSRDFAKSRRRDGTSLLPGQMNRLYAVESIFSNTGAIADHRLPLRSEFGLPFVMALDTALGGGGATPAAEFLKEDKVAKFIAALAEELKTNAGKAVVIAGRRQPPEVHAIVAKINQTIGAVGATLDYIKDPDQTRDTHVQSLASLVKDMRDGHVQTLFILGGNPVYDAPVDLDFTGALGKVQTSVHLSEYADETSLKTTWHVPKAHFLEAWGDARTWDGTVTIAQPLIAPLYGGLSSIEMVAMLLGLDQSAYDLVKTQHASDGDWRRLVHDGYVPNSALKPETATFANPNITPPSGSQLSGSKRRNGELEVVFHQSSFTFDGRFGNNAWLWETPDFLTKVVWDNYAMVSPETATTLGVENDTMITVKLGDKSIDLPCYTMPGQARYSIGLVLGGGRTQAGHVSTHPKNVSDNQWVDHRVVGWDTNKVRTVGGFNYSIGATISPAGKKYELADVQDHWAYEPGEKNILGEHGGFDPEIELRSREDVKEVTLARLRKEPNWRAEKEEEFWDDGEEAKDKGDVARHLSLFEEHQYPAGVHRWGMAIDLNTCTGCNACMVACQSENNIPVVGRREVINYREMGWIRIDRYFQGSPDDPHVVHQPVACQQCENAPCEQVCPVGATSHSEEGLNDMAYNRCIGTRYCANNCPYKVRRFNFLDWNSEFREAREKVRRLLFNPDVTVRMRGVMEKCTYCVQRIQNGKIKTKAQRRAGQEAGEVQGIIPDGTIETACQMACPTEAITFGDIADPDSRVAKLHEAHGAEGSLMSYALLPEMYTKPRTRYIARVRNPNPKLEPASADASGGER
ncbi:MAG TPA: TAT-variant-translocated molybdopterin oxidoreductase [Kofleriaceae bacterium]|jgi:molybdopterin-containing oxidoreductase family iron-sulfur binding subunit